MSKNWWFLTKIWRFMSFLSHKNFPKPFHNVWTKSCRAGLDHQVFSLINFIKIFLKFSMVQKLTVVIFFGALYKNNFLCPTWQIIILYVNPCTYDKTRAISQNFHAYLWREQQENSRYRGVIKGFQKKQTAFKKQVFFKKSKIMGFFNIDVQFSSKYPILSQKFTIFF